MSGSPSFQAGRISEEFLIVGFFKEIQNGSGGIHCPEPGGFAGTSRSKKKEAFRLRESNVTGNHIPDFIRKTGMLILESWTNSLPWCLFYGSISPRSARATARSLKRSAQPSLTD